MNSRIMALWPYWRPIAWVLAAMWLRPLDLWIPLLVWLAALFTIQTLLGDRLLIGLFPLLFIPLANPSHFWLALGVGAWLAANTWFPEHPKLGAAVSKGGPEPAIQFSDQHRVLLRRLYRRAVLWLVALLFLWTLPIAYFSGGAGGAGSWRGWLAQFHLTPDQIEIILWWVRKSIHFTYYGVMAWLAMRAFRVCMRRTDAVMKWVAMALALVWVSGHAGFDELRQAVTEGRTGSWIDFGIDLLGALVFLLGTKRARGRDFIASALEEKGVQPKT